MAKYTARLFSIGAFPRSTGLVMPDEQSPTGRVS
jgi:hypothetical protein